VKEALASHCDCVITFEGVSPLSVTCHGQMVLFDFFISWEPNPFAIDVFDQGPASEELLVAAYYQGGKSIRYQGQW
jgi:hypothetical protein